MNENQTISDVHRLMLDSIVNDCPEVLYKIAINEITSEIQSSTNNLCDYGKDAIYYINLYRCMAEPLGNDVSPSYKGEKCNAGRNEYAKYFLLKVR